MINRQALGFTPNLVTGNGNVGYVLLLSEKLIKIIEQILNEPEIRFMSTLFAVDSPRSGRRRLGGLRNVVLNDFNFFLHIHH